MAVTSTEEDLRAELARLRAENESLRAASGPAAPEPPRDAADRRSRHTRSPWWTVLATVLIVIGAVLAPIGVVATWARAQLTDGERFVDTFAPLVDDPGLQAHVSGEVSTAVNERLNIEGLTSDAIDALSSLAPGDRLGIVLDALEAPIAQGATGFIDSTIARFVASDAFADLWRQLLARSHDQFVRTMEGSPDAAVSIESGGAITLQLGPVIEAVKQRLVDRGFTIAEQIPRIDRTIVLVESTAAPTIMTLYSLVLALGTWLVWVSLAFIVLGVVVARRRALALVLAALALALAAALLLIGIGVGRTMLGRVLPPDVPVAVARTAYDQVLDVLVGTATAVIVLGIAVAVVAWFAGPFEWAQKIRRGIGLGLDSIRAAGEGAGVTTGAFGRWLDRQRVVVWVLIAAVAGVVVALSRPITTGLVVWTLVLALVALLLLELLRRPEETSIENAAEAGEASSAPPPPAVSSAERRMAE